MKIIFLFAVIVGISGIAGLAALTNNIDLTTQEIGIFNFPLVIQEFCKKVTTVLEFCTIEIESSQERIDSNSYMRKLQHEEGSNVELFRNDIGKTDMKKFLLESKSTDSFEGCPVSFWGSMVGSKQTDSNNGYWPVGYNPDDKYGYPAFFNKSIRNSVSDDPTLFESLQSEGDGINKLTRQSVAALLNSAHKEINYPLSIIEIISKTQKSIEDQEYSFADELAFNNNLGKAAFCEKIG